MKKQKIVVSALTLAVLSGATFGLVKFGPTLVHAQTPATQVQQITPTLETQGKESVKANEPANEQAQEKSLPGGGHQDANGANVDHQFEGVE